MIVHIVSLSNQNLIFIILADNAVNLTWFSIQALLTKRTCILFVIFVMIGQEIQYS